MKYKIAILSLLLLFTHSLYGFDENKEGFILGIGTGIGAIKSDTTLNSKKSSETSPSLSTSFKLGYGLNKNFLLYYINDVNWFSLKNSDDIYISALTGIGASYFLKEHNKYFISGAIGVSSLANLTKSSNLDDIGYGVKVGAGYEIKPHIQIESDYTYTKINDSSSKTHSFNLSVHYMWY